MMKKALYITILLLALKLSIIAQEPKTNQQIVERIVESFADDLSDDTDLTPLLEDLERIIGNPLNINNATRQDFEQLYFLSAFQIENLLLYRQKFGQLFSIYELQAIEGFTPEAANDLSPFILFEASDVVRKSYLKQDVHLRYHQTIEDIAGFIEDEEGEKDFAGIKPRLLMKYRAEKGDRLKFGITADNDSGEEFFKGENPYGFDFYSAYVGFRGNGLLKEVYLGDYQVKTGQGLIQWTGYGKRKSSEATNIRLTGQGLRASTSTDENNFLRGIATRFSLGSFDLITFYSNLNVDANITDTDEEGNTTEVSSLQTSGYHRTEGEIYDKDALNTRLAGTTLKYTYMRFAIGVNGVVQKFDVPLHPSTALYNKYQINGDNNYNLSSDLLWVFNRINFFGEAAMSKSGGTALLTGFEAQPANEFAMSIIYRNYAKDFNSIKGTAFAESSGNKNEKGIYTGITVLPAPHIKIAAYLDAYESHWLKFSSNSPVRGTDILFQTDYSPTTNISLFLRMKTEVNSEKSSLDAPIKNDEEQRTSHIRFNLSWRSYEWLSLRFRTEWAGYTKEDINEEGWLFFADIDCDPSEKFGATARVAWFNTDSYNSRIYAYENDVPQYFYIPAFYDKGMRYYINLKYKIAQNLALYMKASQLNYSDKTKNISSGSSLISSPHRTEIKLHMHYRF
jgi:hypothetical protein